VCGWPDVAGNTLAVTCAGCAVSLIFCHNVLGVSGVCVLFVGTCSTVNCFIDFLLHIQGGASRTGESLKRGDSAYQL
jgi:hypothetical protein